MHILKAYNLVKEYCTNNTINRVIDDISLNVEEGEFLSITGESGSGKSTLLYLLSGLESLTMGQVLLQDRDISTLSDRKIAKLRRSVLSFVYQFYNLIPNLTIMENILLPKKMDSVLKKEDNEYLKELVHVASIDNILHRLPSEVSGGEQQRAALIRAVFIKPKIVFADEPTGNLDSKSSEQVLNLLKKINKEYNASVIMVTHSIKQAQMADRTIRLKDGRIIDNV